MIRYTYNEHYYILHWISDGWAGCLTTNAKIKLKCYPWGFDYKYFYDNELI